MIRFRGKYPKRVAVVKSHTTKLIYQTYSVFRDEDFYFQRNDNDSDFNPLTPLWRGPLSYRNQSIDLRSKAMDWFLYDNGLRHERIKCISRRIVLSVVNQFVGLALKRLKFKMKIANISIQTNLNIIMNSSIKINPNNSTKDHNQHHIKEYA